MNPPLAIYPQPDADPQYVEGFSVSRSSFRSGVLQIMSLKQAVKGHAFFVIMGMVLGMSYLGQVLILLTQSTRYAESSEFHADPDIQKINRKGGQIIPLTIEVRSKPGKVNELYQTLQALLPTMRREKECLNCRVSQAMEDCEVYVLSGYRGMRRQASRVISGPSAAAHCWGQSTCWGSRQESRWAEKRDGTGSRCCSESGGKP